MFTTEPYGETDWMVKEIPGMPNTVDVFEHPKQDPKVMEMLKLVVEQRKSVVIVGEGTAKIGLLHKLFTFIPPKDRLTIWAEDIVFSAFNQLDYIPDFDEFRMPDNRYDMREKVL
ncbi:hypothetical protein, partial [Bacillus mycoides]|uniref:hypothetical protein n=1 Tax=Bacillus mycoides TaxID=1405 RepID=UPI003A8090E8